jgi:putative DNA primase/helicase
VHGVPRFGHQRQPRLHGSQLLLNSRGLCDTTNIFGSEPDDSGEGLSAFIEDDDDHDFLWKIGTIAEDWQNGDYDETEALHRIAEVVVDHYHCVRPHPEAPGVRDALYVYEGDDEGIYSPRGKALIESVLEDVLGRYLRNAKLAEIFGHVDRMALELDDAWFQPPKYEAVIDNGIIDFRTGDVRDCTHEEFYTKASRIGHEYDENASCPEIKTFLRSIVDEEDIDTLIHIAAHSLVNAYPTRKAHMLVGDGSNGKSIFLRLLEAFIEGELVDEDEQKDKVSNVELADITSDEHAASDLYGKRLNVGSDISSGTLKDLNVFKKATGGDPIRARRLYENSFTFKNIATMIFALNEVPKFEEDTHAVWSRWVMINFPNEFHPGDENYVPEEELLSKITSQEELEGLFALCVEHLKDALNGGEWWPNVDSASKQREKMKKAAEPFYAAAIACFVQDDDGKIKTEDARECLRSYARQEGLPMGTEFEDASDFGSAMKSVREYDVERKQRRFNGDAKYAYTGISLSPRGLQVLQGERPGEKILSSIEGQDREDAETDVPDESEDDDYTRGKRAGAEVTVKSIITNLNEQNDSEATYRAIVSHCRENRSESDSILDALDRLDESGEIREDEDRVFQVVETDSSDSDVERCVYQQVRDAGEDSIKISVLKGDVTENGYTIEEVESAITTLRGNGEIYIPQSGMLRLTERVDN